MSGTNVILMKFNQIIKMRNAPVTPEFTEKKLFSKRGQQIVNRVNGAMELIEQSHFK